MVGRSPHIAAAGLRNIICTIRVSLFNRPYRTGIAFSNVVIVAAAQICAIILDGISGTGSCEDPVVSIRSHSDKIAFNGNINSVVICGRRNQCLSIFFCDDQILGTVVNAVCIQLVGVAIVGSLGLIGVNGRSCRAGIGNQFDVRGITSGTNRKQGGIGRSAVAKGQVLSAASSCRGVRTLQLFTFPNPNILGGIQLQSTLCATSV